LAAHGEQFLAVIREYCAEHGLAERAGQPDALHRTAPSRSEAIGQLLAAGHSVPEIQAMYGIGQRTVIDHLYRCVLAGQTFPAAQFLGLSELTNEEQESVLAAMRRLGTERLRPICDALNESVTFDKIAVMRLYYLCTEAQSATHNG
jgi:ATP-dependent DNA helicase RecQ